MVKQQSKSEKTEKQRYTQAKGGRKTATAVVRIFNKKGDVLVNDKSYKEYFRQPKNQMKVAAPISVANLAEKIAATVKVYGGGINAQADAVRNGLARAIAKLNPTLKKQLKIAGFITRDARMVERKKYGLKKARRAPQWAKR